MRLYRLAKPGDIDNVVVCEEDVPRPQRGEVLVRVRAVSLNFRDLPQIKKGPAAGPDSKLVPLSDAAGEVAEIGEGVTRFAVGDRVINTYHDHWFSGRYPARSTMLIYGNAQDGWLTEYRVVSQEALVGIPDQLSFEQAATLPCTAVTAWAALEGLHPVTAGDTVLTLGSGSVSLFALQLAKARGAKVVSTTSDEDKAKRLVDLGADAVVDYTEREDWSVAVREATGGAGVERVVEVAGAATFPQSLASAARRASEIVLIGFAGGGKASVDFMDILNTGAAIRWVSVGSRQDTENLVAFVAAHSIEPVIDKVFGFDETHDALRHFESGANFGKVVITL